ncbi:MAG: ATP-binding cassette domain-containing protein [Deltaproteobacteria bacterium]|nr:ATP-binding cassette domain-containing protein [Deltaproteobacteria bacterium]
MMDDNIYKLDRVKRLACNRVLLDIIGLEIAPDRVVRIIGDNGSGKTTLLKILALLDRPDTGHVYVSGTLVEWKWSKLRPLRNKITLLEQFPFCFKGKVIDNVSLGARIRGMPKKEAKRKAISLLEELGLHEKTNQDAGGLSGGELKRVALARALLCDPHILILDEPFSELDEKSGALVTGVLERYLTTKKGIFIYSTHSENSYGFTGERRIFLSGGRLVNKNESICLPVKPASRPMVPGGT